MTEVETLILDKISDVESHVSVINDELGGILQRLSVLETQVESILWLERIVAGIIIAAVIGAVLSLVLKKRNNNK